MMTRMPSPESIVDTPRGTSVWFAPSHPSRFAPQADVYSPDAISPGHPSAGSLSLGAHRDEMNGYPIQPAKIQGPPLRDQTLARDRLLDWLAAKIHQRVILVLADAGYGKTTLLADFSRRTRLRTLWYRLDDDDRDWMSFLSHLIAAGREHDPAFAPTAGAMLSDLAIGGPTREAATDVFLRELPAIATHGAVLILDDFHLVDESPEVRLIARELVARAPDRLSIIFASRRAPNLPLARMRASGEVAELGTDDLRFDATETARLFSETYGRELEPDVLADVAARTEGWAASLQLVQAALRDRSPAEIRRFVRSLSGADQELYDYLAEEVVGDLPDDLQQFLMRTSILQVVSPDLAEVVAEVDTAEVARLSAAAERLTLLTRPSRASRGSPRYHPLVREFLDARLLASIGGAAVASLHRRAADAASSHDWRVAAHHYRMAGEPRSVAQTIAAAIPEIMGSGQHAAAVEEIDQVPEEMQLPILSLLTSRVQMQQRDYEPAIAISHAILETVEPGSQESDHALLNLVTLYLQAGSAGKSRSLATRLRETTSSDQLRLIAEGTRLMLAAGGNGSLAAVTRHLLQMAQQQQGVHPHYYGVTMLNLAVNQMLEDDPESALATSNEAIEALEGTSSRIELSAALVARAFALTLSGRVEESRSIVERASIVDEIEVAFERADLLDSFIDPDAARSVLDSLAERPEATARLLFNLQCAWFYARRGKDQEAKASVAKLESQVEFMFIGQATLCRLTEAYVAVASGAANGPELCDVAYVAARQQGALRWMHIAQLLRAFCDGEEEFGSAIKIIGHRSPWNVTHVADLVGRRIEDFDESVIPFIANSAAIHPGRWRFVLRDRIQKAPTGEGLVSARLLEPIGDRSDVQRLRAYARRQRRIPGASNLGRHLARQLAARAMIEDQSRVSILVGNRVV